jgi:hypothetical protein
MKTLKQISLLFILLGSLNMAHSQTIRSEVEGLLKITSADDHQLEILNTGPGGTSWRLSSTQNGWNAGGGKFIINNSTNSSSSKFTI